MRSARPVDRFAQFLYTEIAISAFSRSFTRFSYFHYFSHDTNTFRTFPEHARSIAITFPRSPNFSEHLSNFFLILCDFMRFFAILSDSLRVFASFTYCEYTRASPNTVFSIIADYRRVSLILLYFTRFYAIFRNFIRFSASFREFHILRVYPSFPEHIIPDYRRLSPIIGEFYLILCPVTSYFISDTPLCYFSDFRTIPF